jgi:hypothetical protein
MAVDMFLTSSRLNGRGSLRTAEYADEIDQSILAGPGA